MLKVNGFELCKFGLVEDVPFNIAILATGARTEAPRGSCRSGSFVATGVLPEVWAGVIVRCGGAHTQSLRAASSPLRLSDDAWNSVSTVGLSRRPAAPPGRCLLATVGSSTWRWSLVVVALLSVLGRPREAQLRHTSLTVGTLSLSRRQPATTAGALTTTHACASLHPRRPQPR
jgi:hypothetical protein